MKWRRKVRQRSQLNLQADSVECKELVLCGEGQAGLRRKG